MSELRRSARTLARRWWPVALAVPLGAAAGAGYAITADPSYAANSYVVVVPQNPGESATAVNFAQAYGRLAGQPQVLAAAAAETGHTTPVLTELVRGTTSPDAPVIEITGTGPRPQEAVRAADAVARSLVAFANASSRETGVRLVSLAQAAEPDRPSTPSPQLDVAVGGAAGVLVGALVMLTRRRGGADGAVPEPAAESAPTAPRPRTGTAPAGRAAAGVGGAGSEDAGAGGRAKETAGSGR
ncbi:Wzz/FepE/Etk N-terminal domain-containing protein [Kitasatospora sp. NPDC054939]